MRLGTEQLLRQGGSGGFGLGSGAGPFVITGFDAGGAAMGVTPVPVANMPFAWAPARTCVPRSRSWRMRS
jgi:hypothetical protein